MSGTSTWPAAGAELLHARLELVERLRPHLEQRLRPAHRRVQGRRCRSTGPPCKDLLDDDGDRPTLPAAPSAASATRLEDLRLLSVDELTERYVQAFAASRRKELERGISLVGPHRDELELVLGQAPAKGYASHGETWSMCLSLRLASYYVMLDDARTGGSAPDPDPGRRFCRTGCPAAA